MNWVLPDVEVLQKAFDRRLPDGRVAASVSRLIDERRLVIALGVREALMMRARDLRSCERLAHILSGFPVPRLPPDHQARAARLAIEMRQLGQLVGTREAELWSAAQLISGQVFSLAPQWRTWEPYGAPLWLVFAAN